MTKQQAVVEEMLTKPSMVCPTLFVGVGGCGCDIAARVAKHLKGLPDYEERYSNLIKFAMIDTNINDLEVYREQADEAFLISDFEKEEYANLAAGKLFLEADDYFTQWVPQDYRFRAGDTAGAGQIRIESRLGAYYQMKHKGMVRRFRQMLEQMKSHEHGHRKIDSSEIRIFICYSVAGGTGSGSHLPLAYALRDQARELGKPSVIGVSVLPSVFEDKTGANKDGTFANGYASLKELEHLMKLGAPESRFYPEDGIEFHYDPSDTSKRRVKQQPFEFVYMIDKPESYSVDRLVDAAADGLFLQLFSPIFKEQSGDYDNYTQHQRFLVPHDFEAKGIAGYTQFYGSYGSAVLLVPVDGLVDYCSRASALSLMSENFLGSIPGAPCYQWLRENPEPFYEVTARDEDNAPVIAESDFHNENQTTRERLRDRLFQKRVRLLAHCEFDENKSQTYGGVFRHGHRLGVEPTATGGLRELNEVPKREVEDLAAGGMQYSIGALALEAVAGPERGRKKPGLMSQAKREMRRKLEEEMSNEPFRKGMTLSDWRAEVPFWQTQLRKIGMKTLREGYTKKNVQVPGMEKLADLSFLDDEAAQVSLTGQRYAVLSLLDELREDFPEPTEKNDSADFPDLDEDKKVKEKYYQNVVEKLYEEALEKAFIDVFQEFVEQRQEFRDNLREVASTLRGLERGYGEFARKQQNALERLRDAGDYSANQFVIDSEALQIENGRRMWDFYFEDKIATLGELSIQNAEIQRHLSGAIRQVSLQRGAGTSAKLEKMYDSLREYAANFLEVKIGGDPKAQDKTRRYGLTLAEALKLEAEYRGLFRTNHEEISNTGRKAIRAAVADYRGRPEDEQVDLSEDIHQEYFRDKIKRIEEEKASLLCSYDESRDRHGGVRPNNIFLGVKSKDFGDPDIERAIESVETAGIKWIEEDWNDPHKIIFYKAVLNVPPYVFGRMDEMKEYYYHFKDLAKRSKVLHIDKNWEDSLPDLDPDGAQEKHRQERVRQHIINFGALLTLNDMFGNNKGFIIHRNGQYYLRPPNSVPTPDDEQLTLLGASLTESIERLPEILEAEKVKYLAFQQMLQGIHQGLAPQALERVVQLPFKWRRNRDQLRTQYGADPSPEQALKLKDYTDSFERMTEALQALLERLHNIDAEQRTIGGGMESNPAGLPEEQAQFNLRQSISILRSFVEGWRTMENPEESKTVPSNFRSLFEPIQKDALKGVLDVLRTGEFDREALNKPSKKQAEKQDGNQAEKPTSAPQHGQPSGASAASDAADEQ